MKKSSKKAPQRASERASARGAAKPAARAAVPAKPAKVEAKVAAKPAAKVKPPRKVEPPTKRVMKPPRPAGLSGAAGRKRAARLRDMLVARHRALLTAYRSGKGSTREATTDGTEDYIDYAVNSYDRDFLLSLTEMEQRQMLLIEEALRRIDRGEYGRCLQCGQEIPEKRLEVEPWARHCVRCQELEEQGLLLQQQGHAFDADYDEEPRVEEAPEVEEEAEPEEDLTEEAPEVDADRDDDDELNA